MDEPNKYVLSINSENLKKIVDKRKNSLEAQIEDFKLHYVTTKLDKVGNVINDTNPLVADAVFFKSINPIGNVDPLYTSEQLVIVYDLYKYLIEQVNMNIMLFQPTLSHFAKFAGITLGKLQDLKHSYDENMRYLVERINSEIFDANMTLAQHKRVTEKSTTYRMKVENEMIEKHSPNVNVNVTAKTIDLDKMSSRLAEIKTITSKQKEYGVISSGVDNG